MVNNKAKNQKKHQKHNFFIVDILICLLTVGIITTMIGIWIYRKNVENSDGHEIEATLELNYKISETPVPGYIQDDKGAVFEDDSIPTMEEVDGGMFEDIDSGLSSTDETYEDLGAVIELFDTSSPEAFKDATLNRCIYANNRYGAQCVSLARSFWWSYADRDVSTCGTGMAKGMMLCADENAGDDFVVFWPNAVDEIQSGDWLVFTGGQYGHVGMALGPVVNGYVTLLGENQGGHYCEGGGSATNIINLNIKNLIGFYRPKAYIKVVPTAPDTGLLNNE